MIWEFFLNALYIVVGIVLITIALLAADILVDITEEDHERYDDRDY